MNRNITIIDENNIRLNIKSIIEKYNILSIELQILYKQLKDNLLKYNDNNKKIYKNLYNTNSTIRFYGDFLHISIYIKLQIEPYINLVEKFKSIMSIDIMYMYYINILTEFYDNIILSEIYNKYSNFMETKDYDNIIIFLTEVSYWLRYEPIFNRYNEVSKSIKLLFGIVNLNLLKLQINRQLVNLSNIIENYDPQKLFRFPYNDYNVLGIKID